MKDIVGKMNFELLQIFNVASISLVSWLRVDSSDGYTRRLSLGSADWALFCDGMEAVQSQSWWFFLGVFSWKFSGPAQQKKGPFEVWVKRLCWIKPLNTSKHSSEIWQNYTISEVPYIWNKHSTLEDIFLLGRLPARCHEVYEKVMPGGLVAGSKVRRKYLVDNTWSGTLKMKWGQDEW